MSDTTSTQPTLSIADMRREYSRAGLTEADLHGDPFVQFEHWFREAMAAEVIETNAMTLATASKDGRPSARVVLLKGFDPEGFVFYTNYESRKGRDLTENPYASLLFYWPELTRQVRVEGPVTKVSAEESAAYFQTRHELSRIGAWASKQSSVIPNREYLEQRVQEISAQFADGEIPLPPHWGGFRLAPDTFEFWHGRPNRLHDRLLYSRQPDGGWTIERLSP